MGHGILRVHRLECLLDNTFCEMYGCGPGTVAEAPGGQAGLHSMGLQDVRVLPPLGGHSVKEAMLTLSSARSQRLSRRTYDDS